MSSANDNPSHNSHNLASNNGNNISDSLASGKSVIATANNVSGASSHIHNLSNVIAPGILLFIDQILLAAGQWIYWLIISKLTSPSEIGISTAFYSLAILVSTVTQLGLEYPLLKRTSTNNGSKILGTIIILEMMLTALSLPVLFYTSNVMYGEASTREYVWITVGILALTSLGFVTRFALLGLSDAKNVLIFDMIGTALKFGAGYLLVQQGYGGMGFLL